MEFYVGAMERVAGIPDKVAVMQLGGEIRTVTAGSGVFMGSTVWQSLCE